MKRGHVSAAVAQLNMLIDYESKKNNMSCALHRATEVFAHVTADKCRDVFADTHKLKRSSVDPCAMRLLGKHCLHRRAKHCPDHMPPSGDHVSLWNQDSKTRLMVWHPYGIIHNDVRRLVEYCDRLGFEFSIDAHSFYYPNSALEICMWRKGFDPLFPHLRSKEPEKE